MAYLLLAVRWVLALTFLGAGLSKVGSPAAFEVSIRRYGLVPNRWVGATARAIITAELLASLALALGLVVPFCAALSAILLGGFAAAVAWNLTRGENFDCGCSANERPISWMLVFIDSVLAGLAVVLIIGPSGALSIWSASAGGGGLAIARALPIPLLVLVALGLWRLAGEARWMWTPLGRRAAEDSSTETLPIHRVVGRGR